MRKLAGVLLTAWLLLAVQASGQGWVEQSQTETLKLGPFLDETDGITQEPGLTITQSDVRISKASGAFAQKNESSSCTHDEAGWYDCDFDATDTNTAGSLLINIHVSGALAVWEEYLVLPSNTYDSLLGSDNLNTNVIAVESVDATDAINAEVQAVIETNKLDHLVAVADNDDPVNGSIVAELASDNGDWSGYVPASDSLEAAAERSYIQKMNTHDTTLMFVDNPCPDCTASVFTDSDLNPDPEGWAGGAEDDFWNGFAVAFFSPATSENYGVWRAVCDYDATATKVTLCQPMLASIPANANYDFYYSPYPRLTDDGGAMTEAGIADAVLEELVTDHDAVTDSLADYVAEIRLDTNGIGGVEVTITNAMSEENDITVVSGDDYVVGNSRQMDIDLTGAPSLSGGSVAWVGCRLTTITPTIVDADTIRLEFTASETGTLAAGLECPYFLVLTDASGYVATVISGDVTVAPSP
jgi:hypothetical protein